jgi:cell wall-associated NlpC family hydrolase
VSRPLAVFACLALLVTTAAWAQPSPTGRSWADAEIRFVVAHGLMARDVSSFRPDAQLTQGELGALVTGLARKPAAVEPAQNDPRSVTMAQLDARLVRGLGLAESATLFTEGARAAGIATPSRFGTEAVARLLGLRINHPVGQDDLELAPDAPATRAEAAFSAAHALRLTAWDTESVKTEAFGFLLPAVTPWQKRVLDTAVKLVGYPYVWAGTSELPQTQSDTQVSGGFDCSGFAWRVFRLRAYPGGSALAKTLNGRTAAAMAGEVPASKRIPYAKLQPADVLFFASAGNRTKANSVDHMGIYLGGGWMIHSSRYGVALASITSDWYRDKFSWGRRPLAEAGLA